jgi:hypothetical protein
MKPRTSVLAVLALAAAAGGGAGITGSTSDEPGETRLVPGDVAEIEPAGRRLEMLCKREGVHPPA